MQGARLGNNARGARGTSEETTTLHPSRRGSGRLSDLRLSFTRSNMNLEAHCSFLAGVVPLEELELLRGDQGKSGTAGDGLRAHVVAELGGVALVALALLTLAGLGGADTDDAGVDAAGDAVLLLDVDLGQVEVLGVESKVVFDVSLGGAVHDVAHLESLDGLVLGVDTTAVGAVHDIGVSLVFLGSSVVSSTCSVYLTVPEASITTILRDKSPSSGPFFIVTP